MKFYKSSTSEFSTSASKCQDVFKSLFPKAIPSSVHIPMKQLTAMKTDTRENTQVLSYVSLFFKGHWQNYEFQGATSPADGS